MSGQITTVEQLEALPEGTVLRTGDARDPFPVVIAQAGNGEPTVSDGNEWDRFDQAVVYYAPLTVLYRPDLPPQDELAAERDRLRAAVDAVRTLIDPASAMAAGAHDGSRWFDEADIRRALDPDKEAAA